MFVYRTVFVSDLRVLFGLGLEPGLADLPRLLPHARAADAAGLDLVSISDHPNCADKVDAYAALGMVLGATGRLSGVVNLTNIGIRSAPLLARTAAGLSALSDRRVILGIGAGSLWDELARLGVPPRTPAESVQAMAETIAVVRALTGGGQPVDFAGHFYQLRAADPSPEHTPDLDGLPRSPIARGHRSACRRMGPRPRGGLAQLAGRHIAPAHRRSSGCGRP